MFSGYSDHAIPGILDKTGSTALTAWWIAHRITSAPHRHAPALNTLSGARHESDDVTVEMVEVHTESFDDLGPNSLPFADQAKQKVFSADVAVAELQCLTKSEFKHLLCSRGKRW